MIGSLPLLYCLGWTDGLLEGLTFTETEQVAENPLGIDAKDESLKQQQKEIEEQKKRITELEANLEEEETTRFAILYFSSFLIWFNCVPQCL